MAEKTQLTLYTDPRLTALGIVHGTTDRAWGNMRLSDAVQNLWQHTGLSSQRILRFKQTHSDRLLIIRGTEDAQAVVAAPPPEADGWILSAAEWGAAIITADCVPLFVWDEAADVIGLSHCGWRGIAAQLPAKTVRHLRQQGAKGRLSAWIGPHIQACCFEVQEDVARQFPQAVLHKNGKLFVDLNQAIKQQLICEGLNPADIAFSSHCTCCEPQHFFSFRRDHVPDAMLSFVYKPTCKQRADFI